MQKSLTFNNAIIPYTLRKSRRARHMRLAVYGDGAVVVTMPTYVHPRFAERFVQEKSAWLVAQIARLKNIHGELPIVQNNNAYLQHKERARTLATERLAHFNAHYGFVYNRLAIRNQRTRWGSCSKKGNLNFSYRIALLPLELADYIIVHELCHLKEFNHSKKFWNLVAETLPHHARLRKTLRARSGA